MIFFDIFFGIAIVSFLGFIAQNMRDAYNQNPNRFKEVLMDIFYVTWFLVAFMGALYFGTIRFAQAAHAGNQMIRCKPNTYPVWGCAFFGLPLMPIKQESKEGIIYKIDSDYPYPYTLINRIDREINSKDLGIKYVFDGFFDDDVGVNPGFIPVIYNPEE